MALFCGIHEKYAMWKFIVDVVHDFVSSLQPDVGRGFLHVSNVFLWYMYYKIIYLMVAVMRPFRVNDEYSLVPTPVLGTVNIGPR